MNIAYGQILIILFQWFIVASLLLILFRLRSIFGLGLLYTALGVFQFLQVFLSSSLFIEIAPEILISTGTTIFFTGSLFAILLIYIQEDALEARKVIYALFIANLFLALIQLLLSWGIDEGGIINVYNLPKIFFTQQARFIFFGTLILLFDAYILIFLYETISRYVSLLFLRIFLTMVLVLSIDTLIFSFTIFADSTQFINALYSGFIFKTISALLYSSLFTLYIIYFEKRVPTSENSESSFKDIFYTLTYRQKYEQVSKEKKTYVHALKKSEAYNRLLFNSSPIGLVLSKMDGSLIDVNPAYSRIIGRTIDETLKLNYWDITPDKYKDQEAKRLKSLNEIGSYGSYEKEYVHKDGHHVPVLLNGVLIEKDGEKLIWSSVEDITERKKTETTIYESEQKFASIYNTVGDVVFYLSVEENGQYRFTSVNDSFSKATGLPKQEVLGKLVNEIIPEPSLSMVLEKYKEAIDKKTIVRWEEHSDYPTGHLIGEVGVAPVFDKDGNCTHLVGSVHDITKRKKAENEIQKLNSGLEQRIIERTAQLEATNKELESFSYSVSHDLRAPLRAIDGFSHALVEDYSEILDEQAKVYLDRIRSGAQRMAQLIDEMLNLAKVTRTSMHLGSVNLSEIVKTICKDLQEIDSQRTAEFIITPDLIDIADPTLIMAVMLNLLDNAWKFTSKKPHTLIEFGLMDIDGKRTYFIRDNGDGFNMNYIEKLFAPFQRLHQSTEFVGTGIGLATVQRIISRHKGKVWAEGKEGEGATFYFTLNSQKSK